MCGYICAVAAHIYLRATAHRREFHSVPPLQPSLLLLAFSVRVPRRSGPRGPPGSGGGQGGTRGEGPDIFLRCVSPTHHPAATTGYFENISFWMERERERERAERKKKNRQSVRNSASLSRLAVRRCGVARRANANAERLGIAMEKFRREDSAEGFPGGKRIAHGMDPANGGMIYGSLIEAQVYRRRKVAFRTKRR